MKIAINSCVKRPFLFIPSFLGIALVFCWGCLFADDVPNTDEPTLYRWQPNGWDNFGDALSQPIVERILDREVKRSTGHHKNRLLSLGSILHSANHGDTVWGSGIMTGWHPGYRQLDVRAVRGPLTRQVLLSHGIDCPPVYGDPALLMSVLFPEFQSNPVRDYIVIPHASETHLYRLDPNFVSPREPWEQVVQKIVESKLVISSSLHGLIVAESYGVPARMLLIKDSHQFFKFKDYYYSTGREEFGYATSIEQALQMGGESPLVFDPQPLLDSFPYDYWN